MSSDPTHPSGPGPGKGPGKGRRPDPKSGPTPGPSPGHEHGHDHDHGPGHAHHHDHDHDHDHEHGQGGSPSHSHPPASGLASGSAALPPPPPPPVALPPGGDSREDAGSVALAEALRSSFVIVRVILAGLVIYFLGSGMFTVSSQERAIVLRFGEPIRRGGQVELGPGLHWAFPYPIDEVIKMPVAQLQTAQSTVGWYNVSPEQEAAGIVPDHGTSLNPAAEGYAITGDGNIIHARAIVRYRVTEPLKFNLNHAHGASMITNLVDNALSYAAARYRVDDALRRDQAGFKELVLKRLGDLLTAHDLGVTVEVSDVVTKEPRQVKADFDAVLSAEVDRGKTVSEAQAYGNRVVNEARGQATARINTGETDRSRLVQAVASEAQKFTSLLPEYRKNPAFFTARLQTETLGRVFTNAQDKFYLPLSGRDQLWLHLNREAEKPVKQTLQ